MRWGTVSARRKTSAARMTMDGSCAAARLPIAAGAYADQRSTVAKVGLRRLDDVWMLADRSWQISIPSHWLTLWSTSKSTVLRDRQAKNSIDKMLGDLDCARITGYSETDPLPRVCSRRTGYWGAVLATENQKASMRRMGPGNEPLKRRLWRPAGVSKKRSGSEGASRLMTDSMPTAKGFSRISLNFRVISQAASKPFGAGLKVYCLRSKSLEDADLVVPCSVKESARKSSAS